MAEVEPAAGQIWQDNDPRLAELGDVRLVRISEIDEGRAVCEAWYENRQALSRTVRIRLDRFRPTSTGYRFLRDDAGGES